MPVYIFLEDPDEVPVLRSFAEKLLCEQMQAGIAWMEVSLMANLSKITYCSARDWDGKDYLRIIPRVVW